MIFYGDLGTRTHEGAKITEGPYWFFTVVKIAAVEFLAVFVAKMYDIKHTLDAKSFQSLSRRLYGLHRCRRSQKLSNNNMLHRKTPNPR